MALAERIDTAIARGAAPSYGGRGERSATRLTSEEARLVNYVLVGWESEVGLASNFAGMVAALAARALPSEHRRAARTTPDGGAGSVPELSVGATADGVATMGGHVGVFDANAMTPVDRWSNDRSGFGVRRREKILRAWRAIVTMSRARHPSVLVLHALLGDLPPGLSAPGTLSRDPGLDTEYRRVVRYIKGAPPSGVALEARLHVDHAARPNESPAQRAARIVEAEAERRSYALELGAQCEIVIGQATTDYRAALRAVSA